MLKVVLIEDNEPNAEIVVRRLTMRGFQVFHAPDGKDGLGLIARERPDIVLLDVQMPKLDGYQVVRAIKADPGTAHIPVVLMSAGVVCGAAQLAHEVGAEAYVTKPVPMAQLLDTMRRLTGKSSTD